MPVGDTAGVPGISLSWFSRRHREILKCAALAGDFDVDRQNSQEGNLRSRARPFRNDRYSEPLQTTRSPYHSTWQTNIT